MTSKQKTGKDAVQMAADGGDNLKDKLEPVDGTEAIKEDLKYKLEDAPPIHVTVILGLQVKSLLFLFFTVIIVNCRKWYPSL